MTAAAISKTNLFNVFEIIRTCLKASNLATSNAQFASNDHYYEYDPAVLSRNFNGYPYAIIETDMGSESVSIKYLQEMSYSVDIKLCVQYHARSNITTYAQDVIQYFNTNQDTLLSTYNINAPLCSFVTDTEFVEGQKIATCTITLEFNSIVDVET